MGNEFSSGDLKKYWEDEYVRGVDGIYDGMKDDTLGLALWWSFLRPRMLCKDDVLLEVGCGVGNKIAGIHEEVKEVYGFDVSATAIEYANRRFENIDNVKELIVADNLDAYQDSFFDIIYCDGVFMHMMKADTRKYLSEFRNKIKDSGHIFVQFTYNSVAGDKCAFNGKLNADPSASWSEDEIREAMEMAGLKIHSLSSWDISWQVRWNHEYKHYWVTAMRLENKAMEEWFTGGKNG